MNRVPVTLPRYGAEDSGCAVILADPRSGVLIGLYHHDANPGQPFHEGRTGLDHISFGVSVRAGLEACVGRLDGTGAARPAGLSPK